MGNNLVSGSVQQEFLSVLCTPELALEPSLVGVIFENHVGVTFEKMGCHLSFPVNKKMKKEKKKKKEKQTQKNPQNNNKEERNWVYCGSYLH